MGRCDLVGDEAFKKFDMGIFIGRGKVRDRMRTELARSLSRFKVRTSHIEVDILLKCNAYYEVIGVRI